MSPNRLKSICFAVRLRTDIDERIFIGKIPLASVILKLTLSRAKRMPKSLS